MPFQLFYYCNLFSVLIMSSRDSWYCYLCNSKSKIPICDSPSRGNIENIIRSAKNRVERSCFGKYKDCEKLSLSHVEALLNISYHRSCFKDFTRSDLAKSTKIATHNVNLESFVSNFIEHNVIRLNGQVDVKTLADEFKRLDNEYSDITLKKKIKSIIDNRSDVFVFKPLVANRPEVIASKTAVEAAFFKIHDDRRTNELDQLTEAFQKARNMILSEPDWQFEGNFRSFKVNEEVLTLFKTLIGGNNPDFLKTDMINTRALLLVQYIQGVILSERQVSTKIEFFIYQNQIF